MAKDYISEEKENIIKEILRSKKVRPGQLINYAQFLELYEPYKEEMSEKYFANIVRISYTNFRHIKKEKRRTRILKDKAIKLTEEREKQIRNELQENGKVKEKESISYNKFLELYRPYKYEMTELDFAQVLRINSSSYNSLRNSGKNAIILKDKSNIKPKTDNNKNELPSTYKEKTIYELLQRSDLKPGKSIDYTEFLELYEPYKETMLEKDFATILGITYDNLRNIKNKGQRSRIFKQYVKETTEEQKEYIIKDLKSKGKITPGKLITYEEFLILYKPYASIIKENKFAELLGFTYDSWLGIKNKGAKAKIKDAKIKEKIDKIKYIINKEPRYYSKEELENIAKKYELDLDTLIVEICFNGKNVYLDKYKEALENKGKLYIGEIGFSKEFAKKYSKYMLKTIDIASKNNCKLYGCLHVRKDIASESLVYLLDKCGDIEKNFKEDDEAIKKLIFIRISSYIKYRSIREITRKKEFPYKRSFKTKVGEQKELDPFNLGIEDETENVEDDVIEKVAREEKGKEKNRQEECINMLMKNVELGISREESLRIVASRLGMSQEEMLESLQSYMIETKRAKKLKDGKYIIGYSDEEGR